VMKKALLDKAVQEYLTQQALKLEEIVLRHNVMVEYLKGIVGGQTHYHSSQKVQQHNALLHAKALEVNAGISKYLLKEIQQMVKEGKQLQNLTQEEMDQYITALNDHHNTKVHGVQANNVAAAQDIYQCTYRDCLTTITTLRGLCNCTGIYATLLVMQGHINNSIQSTWNTMDNSAEFWEDVFGHQIVDVAHQYEQWACTQNQNLIEHDSLGNLHKQITKAISSGLERITNKKHIVMNYHSYETVIVETYGVHLVGWPNGVKFTNPSTIGTVGEAQKLCDALHSGSCFWKKLSKNKLELFITELNTCHAAGKAVWKPRKKCSDAGVSWKCKAPTSGKENI
ncbi:hypothetical protein EDC04DRAFT_2583640, partial [Pisolithus marmoratus]